MSPGDRAGFVFLESLAAGWGLSRRTRDSCQEAFKTLWEHRQGPEGSPEEVSATGGGGVGAGSPGLREELGAGSWGRSKLGLWGTEGPRAPVRDFHLFSGYQWKHFLKGKMIEHWLYLRQLSQKALRPPREQHRWARVGTETHSKCQGRALSSGSGGLCDAVVPKGGSEQEMKMTFWTCKLKCWLPREGSSVYGASHKALECWRLASCVGTHLGIPGRGQDVVWWTSPRRPLERLSIIFSRLVVSWLFTSLFQCRGPWSPGAQGGECGCESSPSTPLSVGPQRTQRTWTCIRSPSIGATLVPLEPSVHLQNEHFSSDVLGLHYYIKWDTRWKYNNSLGSC